MSLGKNEAQDFVGRYRSLVPSDWKGFLRVDENKSELFRFLSQKLFHESDGAIISAFDSTVISLPLEDVTLMSPTDHEEADTRLFLHVNDMSHKGLKSVMKLLIQMFLY